MLVRIIILLSNPGNGLHLPLLEFTLPVIELILNPLIFLDPVEVRLVFVFELGEIHLWVIFSEILHPCLLLFPFDLFLLPLFKGLFLVDLQLLVLDLLRRKLMIRDVDEVELALLTLLLD